MNKILLEDEICLISTQTLHRLYKNEKGHDAVSLYLFYYYHSKIQKTNQPKALNEFCIKGLKWGEVRFKRAKNILKENNLIEDVQHKSKDGKIRGCYIKLNYIWKKEKAIKAESILKKKCSPPPPVSTGVEKPVGGFPRTNALSENNREEIIENREDIVHCVNGKSIKLFCPTPQACDEEAQNSPLQNGLTRLDVEKIKEVDLVIGSQEKSAIEGNVVNYNPIDLEIAWILLSMIRQNNPTFKEPNLKKWAVEINKMIRIDKRDPKDIVKVIIWCQKDSFWCANILSGVKLRKQYDQLFVKMNIKKSGGIGGLDKIIERHKNN